MVSAGVTVPRVEEVWSRTGWVLAAERVFRCLRSIQHAMPNNAHKTAVTPTTVPATIFLIKGNVTVEGLEVAEEVGSVGGSERVVVGDFVEEDDEPVGMAAEDEYIIDKICGGGASKVSSVGWEQFEEPSGLEEQQRHNLALLS